MQRACFRLPDPLTSPPLSRAEMESSNASFSAPSRPKLPWYVRGLFVIFGTGLITLLIVAMCLKPSPKGFGTHTQLGLNPCSFTTIVGFRCPSCGMTTSWAHFVRGNIIQSLKSNSGGTMLALTSAIAGPWLLASGLLGRWWIWQPNEWVVVAVASLIVLVTMVDWGIRLSQ